MSSTTESKQSSSTIAKNTQKESQQDKKKFKSSAPTPREALDLSWSFPDDVDELNSRMKRVYSGFKAKCSDEAFLKAKKEELELKKNDPWLLFNVRVQQRMFVHEARKVLSDIRFDEHESFYFVDLSRVAFKLREWRHELPFARPYYAVKSNPNPGVLHTVAALGGGFDCASREELHSVVHVLALAKKHNESGSKDSSLRSIPHINTSKSNFKGNSFSSQEQDEGDQDSKLDDELLQDPDFRKEVASRIIFTHSIKEISHIEFAKKIGVRMTVADNETELRKIHKFWPDALVILRVVADDRNSNSSFSVKFGATKNHIKKRLIPLSRELGLEIVGVSFHAGSLSKDVTAFSKAISDARLIFDWGKQSGYHMNILDLGGGWPEAIDWEVPFEEFAQEVRKTLEQHFFSDGTFSRGELSIVAEPGRYIVGESHALVATIVGFRDTTADDEDEGEKGLKQESEDEMKKKAQKSDYRDTAMKQLDHYQYYINDGLYGGLGKYSHELQPLRVHTLKLTNSEEETLELASKQQKLSKSSEVFDESGKNKDLQEARRCEKKREAERPHQKHHPEQKKESPYQGTKDCEADYHKEVLFHSTLFGQTCDGSDAPAKKTLLPRLNIGDVLVFPQVGAYTLASSTHFNGFSDDRLIYLYVNDSVDENVLSLHKNLSKLNA